MGGNWDLKMKIEVFSRLEHNYISAPIVQLAEHFSFDSGQIREGAGSLPPGGT